MHCIAKDIWQNLYEFYLIEGKEFEDSPDWQSLQPFVEKIEKDIFFYQQRLTHQILQSKFHKVTLILPRIFIKILTQYV